MKKSLTVRKLEIAVDNLCIKNALLTSYFVAMQNSISAIVLRDVSPAVRNRYLDTLSSFCEKEALKQLEVCKEMLLDEKNAPLIQSGYEQLQAYLESIQKNKV